MLFSNYGWMFPLKDQTGIYFANAMRDIFAMRKMPKSQNEWSRSRLNKTLLVKWNCELID